MTLDVVILYNCQGGFGAELAARAVRDALRAGKPDMIFLPAETDLQTVHGKLEHYGIPLVSASLQQAGQTIPAGLTTLTYPALTTPPFQYTRIRLAADRIDSQKTIQLALTDFPDLFDAHIHTRFAYCAGDLTTDGTLARLELLGLRRAGLMEHADHLYVSREGFRTKTDTDDPAALRRSAEEGNSRVSEFRSEVMSRKSDRIFVGLEAEPAGNGTGLALLPEDVQGCDYLLGAVHHLDERHGIQLSAAETNNQFIARCRQLAEAGVNILAHPFRYFPRVAKRPAPEDLYRPLATLLAEHKIAAEINFHQNTNDPEFFSLCLKRGVKLSLGTDSHTLVKVGELRPHIDFLRELDVLGRLDEILWQPAHRRIAPV